MELDGTSGELALPSSPPSAANTGSDPIQRLHTEIVGLLHTALCAKPIHHPQSRTSNCLASAPRLPAFTQPAVDAGTMRPPTAVPGAAAAPNRLAAADARAEGDTRNQVDLSGRPACRSTARSDASLNAGTVTNRDRASFGKVPPEHARRRTRLQLLDLAQQEQRRDTVGRGSSGHWSSPVVTCAARRTIALTQRIGRQDLRCRSSSTDGVNKWPAPVRARTLARDRVITQPIASACTLPLSFARPPKTPSPASSRRVRVLFHDPVAAESGTIAAGHVARPPCRGPLAFIVEAVGFLRPQRQHRHLQLAARPQQRQVVDPVLTETPMNCSNASWIACGLRIVAAA